MRATDVPCPLLQAMSGYYQQLLDQPMTYVLLHGAQLRSNRNWPSCRRELLHSAGDVALAECFRTGSLEDEVIVLPQMNGSLVR